MFGDVDGDVGMFRLYVCILMSDVVVPGGVETMSGGGSEEASWSSAWYARFLLSV